jgi:hypothetical protein
VLNGLSTTVFINGWGEIVTAAGRGQLRSLPLNRLRKYVEAYNIKVNGAIEKDDYIDHVISARVRVTTLLWCSPSDITSRV